MPTREEVARPLQPRRSVAAVLSSLAATREREAAELRELAAALDDGEADAMIPHRSMPWSPRKAAELCRSGAITGATKQGKIWFARRSAVEAFIAAGEPSADPTVDEVDVALERALRRAR